MKHLIFIALLLSLSPFAEAQKKSEKKISLRGPVTPLYTDYSNYKSHSIKVNVPAEFDAEMKKHKVPFSPSVFAEGLSIMGLKNEIDGDFRIQYNITRFQIIEYKTIEKSPAVVVGLEANLKVTDKDNNLIFSRYLTPRSNTFLFQTGTPYEKAVLNILERQYWSWISDFSNYFLYNPVYRDLQYFELTKLPKNSNLADLNLSAQVFPNVFNVQRSEWGGLFEEAQKYWVTLLKFKDPKDEDITKEVRFVAAFNLSTSYLLLGNKEKAIAYQAIVKENDKKFLGSYYYYDEITKRIDHIKEFQTAQNETGKNNPVQDEPVLSDFQKTKEAFEFLVLQGEVLDKKNEKFKGSIKITNENPPVVDFRTGESGSITLGSVLSLMKTDNNSAYITVPNSKKPVKRKLDDIISIKTDDGKTYIIGSVGSALEANARYSLLEEVKTHKNISVFKEFFPQDSYTLKKASEKSFFEISGLAPKKSLIKFFESCPAMQKSIEKGGYNDGSKENYIKLFEEYTKLCK
jgi:hypothetical protein